MTVTETPVKQTRFQETLRYYARTQRKTQKQIAERMGVSDMAVYWWMAGTYLPTVENIGRLERVLNLDPGTLLIAAAYPYEANA